MEEERTQTYMTLFCHVALCSVLEEERLLAS